MSASPQEELRKWERPPRVGSLAWDLTSEGVLPETKTNALALLPLSSSNVSPCAIGTRLRKPKFQGRYPSSKRLERQHVTSRHCRSAGKHRLGFSQFVDAAS